jgi:hypothetical protein
MRNRLLSALVALALASGATACTDFLTGEGITTDPNNPTTASATALFVAAQANMNVQMEHHLARGICLWLQACAGRGPQYGALGIYDLGQDEFTGFWDGTYGGGGLLDLRKIRNATLASRDSVFAGMAMVLEAYLVGTTADVWGDIPYRTAVSGSDAPTLDPQQQVYGDLQALLDTAIVFLQKTGPTNKGPGTADLEFDGDATKWKAMANTLKARYFLHTVEKPTNLLDPVAYDSAFFYAGRGISSPANDFTAYHSSASPERNLWYQFTVTWTDFIKAGKNMVELLKSTNDPRLSIYYDSVASLGDVIGADPVDTVPLSNISDLGATRLSPDFRQPLVTWGETQLILAEAALGKTPTDPAAALAALESVRAAAGLAPLTPAPSGPALFTAIMTEKYITMFQTIEAWSDYRRTCVPALTPAPGGQIPARVGYPADEQNTNPNIPDAGPLRNWNDPNLCP